MALKDDGNIWDQFRKWISKWMYSVQCYSL